MGNLGTSIDLYTPNNPMSPYFAVKIDGKVYDLTVNFLKNLRFKRVADNYGEWSISIEDTMDLSLEAKLWSLLSDMEGKRVCFQYGWVNGLRSEWHVGLMNDYLPSFHSNMAMTLTMQGIISPNDDGEQIVSFKGKNASDIVQQICDNEGWPLVECDKADPFDKEQEFIQGNERSIDFIRNKIAPEATCNGTPLQFVLEHDADGPRAYFIKADKRITTIKENYNFMINSGNYGSVISFDPSYHGINVMPSASEAYGFVDIESNEITVYNAQASAAASQPDLNVYGATSSDKMRHMISNRFFDKNIGNYQATLVIVGNPTIRPLDFINILPFRPDGTIHHTGGTYQILEIEDTIEGGTFTSTLTLAKYDVPETGQTLPFSSIATYGGVDGGSE